MRKSQNITKIAMEYYIIPQMYIFHCTLHMQSYYNAYLKLSHLEEKEICYKNKELNSQERKIRPQFTKFFFFNITSRGYNQIYLVEEKKCMVETIRKDNSDLNPTEWIVYSSMCMSYIHQIQQQLLQECTHGHEHKKKHPSIVLSFKNSKMTQHFRIKRFKIGSPHTVGRQTKRK